jgi:hypothetical protein
MLEHKNPSTYVRQTYKKVKNMSYSYNYWLNLKIRQSGYRELLELALCITTHK